MPSQRACRPVHTAFTTALVPATAAETCTRCTRLRERCIWCTPAAELASLLLGFDPLPCATPSLALGVDGVHSARSWRLEPVALERPALTLNGEEWHVASTTSLGAVRLTTRAAAELPAVLSATGVVVTHGSHALASRVQAELAPRARGP